MSEHRPLDERPAARPTTPPASTPEGFSPSNPVPPNKGGLGCFGIGCLGIIGVVVLVVIITLIAGAVNGGSSGGTGSSPGGSRNLPVKSATQTYVDFVRTQVAKQGHSIADVSDATLIVLGEQACGAFDRGATEFDILLEISVQDLSEAANDTGVIAVAGAVAYLCPEHKNKIG